MIEIESSVIRKLTAELKSICPNVFFGKSQIIYPKINCDLRLFEETSYNVRYRLTLDYFSNDSTPLTVVRLSEQVREAFFGGMIYDEYGALIALRKTNEGGFLNERDSMSNGIHTDAANEKIVRYFDAYEVAYYKNQEI